MEKTSALGEGSHPTILSGEGIDYAAFESAIGLNWYEVDPNLRFLADRLVEPEDRDWVEEHLQRMGALCGGPIAARAEVIDKNPPRLERYDQWGEEVNKVIHHPAALETKRDLWQAGFIGLPWSAEAKQRPRPIPPMLTAAFSYLLSQADTGMYCAVGMTAGLAGIVERHAPPWLRDLYLPHLTTMDFAQAWDGAMFMTEVRGGSDLASSETQASLSGDHWLLNGSKWFCSNVDAKAILTLARPQGAPPGLRGLALFLVPHQRRDGSANGIRIKRLKDKLGTRAVPTGEVDFVDAEAYLLAGEKSDPSAATDGRGINRMMEMVNVSRLGVALMGLGIMRRSFLEAAIYAARRQAFGRPIRDFPMVRETLVNMLVEIEAAAALTFEAAQPATKDRNGARRLQRILVPLAKFRAARRGVELASQAIEILGGNGYIEDWPAARQLRDAQAHTIWEGTENIICLDVQRAMVKEAAHEALLARVDEALAVSGELAAGEHVLAPSLDALERARTDVREVIAYLAGADRDLALLHARRMTDFLADLAEGALLVEEAAWELGHRGSARKAVVSRIFAETHLTSRPLRGITRPDRTVLELFEAIVGYAPIPREALAP